MSDEGKIKKLIDSGKELSVLQIGFIFAFIVLLIIFLNKPIKVSPVLKKHYYSKVIEQGYISCFPENMKYDNGNTVIAEPSGVVYYHRKIFLINDKPIPGSTPLMQMEYQIPFNRKIVSYVGNDYVRNARKFEDMAVTPNLKYMFMITAFDRYDSNAGELDSYNTLIYKKLQPEGPEMIAYPSTRDSVDGSIKLREKIRYALRSMLFKYGPPYFKVEGIAAIPGNILLIGIREEGKSFKNFTYCVKILGAKYKIENGEFIFVEKLREIYRFKPKKNKYITKELGLSSIEYDKFNDRLYILTSYELGAKDESIGGYLWMLSLKDFRKMKFPELVMENEFTPLHFAHKPEGVTVLNNNEVFIIHDDDNITGSDFIYNPNIQFKRKLNEAAYSIVQIIETE